MSKLKGLAIPVAAAALAAALASPAASAGLTANAAAVSEYMFRGLEQSGGAAVQGGLDFSTDAGFYAGTWVSNTGGPAAAGGTEWDLYGGYAFKAGALGLDFGAIYYLYNEDEEDLTFGNDPITGAPIPTDFDYFEVYAKATISYFGLQVYFSPDYLGDNTEYFADGAGKDTDALYVNLLANFPLSETVTLGFQVGSSMGDGVEVAWGDEYVDYSVSATKALDAGFAFSIGLYGTTLDEGQGFGTVPHDDDSVKPVVGLKKTFDF